MDHLLMPFHIAAGSVGVITGYTALFAGKGRALHRKSGLTFVVAMMIMGVLATIIASIRGIDGSVGAGLVTTYFVLTGLTTVRPLGPRWRWVDAAGLVVVSYVAVITTLHGIEAVRLGGVREGVYAPVLILFAVVSFLAAAGDIRVMRKGPLTGTSRIARHLWRMCYSLYIAAGSFFLGQADEFPEALRIWPVLFALALAPLVILLYWMWRVRIRKSLRGLVTSRVGATVNLPLSVEPAGD